MTQLALEPPITAFDFAAFDRYVMGTYARFPIALDRGEGCRVWDTDGREYLDFVAGIATCSKFIPAIISDRELRIRVRQNHS